MSYKATVLNVMIASPSDVAAERQIVRDVVYEWNAVHSKDRGTVLMPVGWESHSFPAMGDRPQEIINGQILKDADILVAVFWTKFGSPTGKADSGTEEEINEHLADDKPALLYFSSEPVHPDSIDSEQYAALTAFKDSIKTKGLFQAYESKSQFRELLARHLSQTVLSRFPRENTETVEFESLPAAPLTWTAPAAALSESAKELLIEASKDRGGIIMRLATIGSYHVQTNGRDFVQSNDARSAAKWRAAVDDLAALGLIEDRGGKGEVFFITDSGYELADLLSTGTL